MEGLNRRDFLKVGAVATTAAAAACTYDYKVPQEEVLPYVVNPENVQPGLASYYASLCNGCATACGLVARNKDGRVVHVEGNPDHPSGPGLCTKGHFDLVAAYGPDRVPGPTDGRSPMSWDDAQKKVNDAVAAARAAGKGVAWLGKYRTGSAAALLDVLESSGLRRVHWELLGVETLLAATASAFGVDELPVYELAEAHTILSFGYDFLGAAFGSMGMTKGWAKAKNPAEGGFAAKLIAIEPRLGISSTHADLWLSASPGSEAKVAYAIASLAAVAKGYSGPATALLATVDVAAAAAASGIPEARLKEVAETLAGAPSVVLPGGLGTASADATELAVASLLLNEVLGNIGKTVQFGRGFRPGRVSSFADVKALLDDLSGGKIGVLFLDGVDLAHVAPAELGAAEALAKADLVVQFADEPNDSSNDKTLLLPTGSGLEGWTDASTESAVHVLGQPAMVPLQDSRPLGEVLLAMVKANPPAPVAPTTPPVPTDAPPTESTVALAAVVPSPVDVGALAVAAANFGEFVKARWVATLLPAGENAESWWRGVQAKGVYVTPINGVGAAWVRTTAPVLGSSAPNNKSLVLFSSHLGDGRWANVPWAQELPDPVSTYFWNTWIELHPSVATAMGLAEQDLVTVKTDKGSVTVGWFGSPTVREDTVAIVIGNGRKTGRYARERGANVAALLGATTDAASGALMLSCGSVEISRAGGAESGVHALCGSLTQEGRPIALAVNPVDAVEKLTGEPESILPIEHLEIDERVRTAGPVDMYPEPGHPTYRFATVFDTNACNGCGACQIACALENNTAFVGPDQLRKGRTMVWIRMDRFFEGSGENPDVRYLPAVCQHCAHAPCEGVCPVLATYHNLDGLNAMIYNRCVGTRYCANNCPYASRRFNYHTWQWPESYHLMLNPDLSTREMGVMEKCTFCVQRTRAAKDAYRDIAYAERTSADRPVEITKHTVPDSALHKLTACAAACPSEAITFGNWKDTDSKVRKLGEQPRAYTLLGELNTKPGVRYLARVNHNMPRHVAEGHGAEGHGAEGGAGEAHAEQKEG